MAEPRLPAVRIVTLILTVVGDARAQRLDLGHQMARGYVVAPPPTLPNYGASRSYQPAPAYNPVPSYQSSAPRYLPSYGGGVAGSTFDPE